MELPPLVGVGVTRLSLRLLVALGAIVQVAGGVGTPPEEENLERIVGDVRSGTH